MNEARRRMRGGLSAGAGARAAVAAVAALLVGLGVPGRSAAQTMPGPVYHHLIAEGHTKLAKRISDRLQLRSGPDAGDVTDLLERWTREAGGPTDGWDWVAVTRLWLRAGRSAEAEMALHRAEDAGGVPASVLLLDQARTAFLSGDPAIADRAYWKGCEGADESASIEYWLDIEVLATPDEIAEWDRIRRLPVTQRNLCGFLHRFWSERALASGLTVAARMSRHYARMRYALDNYRRRGKEGPGFTAELGRPTNSIFDDRGLLFIRMGPPDRETSFAGNPSIGQDAVSAECYQPNTSWAYDYPGGTRVYHLTASRGIDDYWLVQNLAAVYRCGNPAASISASTAGRLSPVNESRGVNIGQAASLVLQDLYRSRQGLDSKYAQAAQRMSDPSSQVTYLTEGRAALEGTKVLDEERDWTRADAEFAVASVPDRPDVEGDTRLLMEELQFESGQNDRTRLWLNGVVEGDHLTPDRLENGSYRYRVEARWTIVDANGELVRRDGSFEATTPHVLGKDESVPVRMAVDLAPGLYRYNVVVRDAHAAGSGKLRSGNWHRATVTVRDMALRLPVLSDVAVAPDSASGWLPLAPSGPDAGLRPSPSHLLAPDGTGWMYFESYGLTAGGAYTTRVRLVPADGKGESFDLSFEGEVPEGAGSRVRRLLRLDLSDARPGRYDMTVRVRDEATGSETLPYETAVTVSRPAS